MTLCSLRDCLVSSGCNKTDNVITLISACIESELDGGSAIVSAVCDLGYNPRHVGILLKKNTGSDPKRSRWIRNADGRYRMHE